MLIFGHRGSSGTEPENTLRAFRAAVGASADGVELDVQATADGVPVVIHDHDVSRTTNGRGQVAELTLAELRLLDAGQGELLPTLDEVLDLLAGVLTVDLEIKQTGIEASVLAVLARHPAARWFISSFDWNVLREVRLLSSTAELWPLANTAADALFAAADSLKSPGIALTHKAYTPEVAQRCAGAGLAVAVWTVNDPDEGRRVQELSAATLMTDYPAMMRSAIGQDIA